jgi:hypothetical protein
MQAISAMSLLKCQCRLMIDLKDMSNLSCLRRLSYLVLQIGTESLRVKVKV